ncbi:MAG: hypothetical protein ACKOBS_04075, partial [Verrucomicrobiota bacterium]
MLFRLGRGCPCLGLFLTLVAALASRPGTKKGRTVRCAPSLCPVPDGLLLGGALLLDRGLGGGEAGDRHAV